MYSDVLIYYNFFFLLLSFTFFSEKKPNLAWYMTIDTLCNIICFYILNYITEIVNVTATKNTHFVVSDVIRCQNSAVCCCRPRRFRLYRKSKDIRLYEKSQTKFVYGTVFFSLSSISSFLFNLFFHLSFQNNRV